MSGPPQRTTSREAANTPQRTASREAANTPQRTASREAANTPQRTASREAANTPQRTASREAANTPQRTASREAANTPQRTASREAANTPQRTASREALNYATKLLKKNMRELVAEFNQIPKDVNAAEYRSWANNLDRNRYKDVYCLDSTRVRLAWPEGTKDDYIHANRIEGGFPELNNELIATQAPLENTIGDFWRMVWQEKASIIVMLCQLVEENNKKKADLYWPLEPRQKPIKLDDFGLSIENIGVQEQPEKQMRVSQLRVKGRSSKTGEIREHAVTHVMWRGWPDRDVPASAMKALQLLYNVRGSSNGVVIVHCSAGIGRTGTIIALEIALRRLRAGQEIDVKGIVTKLREQRYKACQNCHQYLYIHYALLSYLAAKGIVTNEDFNKFKMAYEAIKKN